MVTLSSSRGVVQVADSGQRRDFLGALDDGGPQPPDVVHGHVERPHQRAGVLAEALLARHEPVAVVQVFDLALLVVVGEAHVVVRRQQQAGALALQPLGDRRDLLRGGLLFGRADGRARTPSACRCRPGSVRRSAACSRPGRCAGRPRPGARWPPRRAPGRPGRTGGRAPACPRCPAGSWRRRTPASRRRATATLRTSVIVEKRFSISGRVPLRLPGIAPRPVDADPPAAGVRRAGRGSGCRCVALRQCAHGRSFSCRARRDNAWR